MAQIDPTKKKRAPAIGLPLPASTLATDYSATLGCTTRICGACRYPQPKLRSNPALAGHVVIPIPSWERLPGRRNATRSRGGGSSRPRFARGANGNHSLKIGRASCRERGKSTGGGG